MKAAVIAQLAFGGVAALFAYLAWVASTHESTEAIERRLLRRLKSLPVALDERADRRVAGYVLGDANTSQRALIEISTFIALSRRKP